MLPFQTDIPTLGNTASFYDWFNQYNDEVLGKLNNADISRPLAGDGITFASSNNGGYTFELSGTVAKQMTFQNSVVFSGNVSLGNVEVSGLIYGVSGNYLGIGVTTGKVVRLTNTGGLTLAKADAPENAEVMGIAISADTTRTLVAVAGKISGSTLANNLISGGFTSSCVFFLDPVVAGGITRTEPTTLGHVSKPVILGVNSSEGLILPYRGQHINGICGGSGDNIFNSAIFITVVSKGETEANFALRPGTIISSEAYFTNITGEYESSISSNGYSKATSFTDVEKIIGFVSEYVGSYTTSGNITLKVNTSGSVINDIINYSQWTGVDSGVVYLDDSGLPTLVKPADSSMVIGNVSDKDLVLNIRSLSQITTNTNTEFSSVVLNTSKILINGSLSLWQRGRGICGGFGVTANQSNVKPYVADRWILWGASGENGFTAERVSFPAIQIDVPGYPKYHVSLIKNTTVASNRSYFYNVIEDSRTVANKELTFSFYARTPEATGSFSINSIRYNTASGYIDGTTHTVISTSDLNWRKYTTTFVAPSVTSTNITYFLIGIGLQENGKTFQFAQFMLEEGSTASSPKFVTPEDEYPRAASYYQRSYLPDEVIGSATETDNRGIIGDILPRMIRLYHKFQYPMIKIPEVYIYSLKGKTSEVSFNISGIVNGNNWVDSSDASLLSTSAQYCFFSGSGSPGNRANNIPNPNYISNVTKTKTDFFFAPIARYCWFDTVGFHYVADADTIIY